jgi:hypothetical protein
MFTEANGRGEHHFQGVDKSVSTEMKSHQLFYLMTHSKCNFGVKFVNCCCFLNNFIYSFSYIAASNQQTPVFKA